MTKVKWAKLFTRAESTLEKVKKKPLTPLTRPLKPLRL